MSWFFCYTRFFEWFHYKTNVKEKSELRVTACFRNHEDTVPCLRPWLGPGFSAAAVPGSAGQSCDDKSTRLPSQHSVNHQNPLSSVTIKLLPWVRNIGSHSRTKKWPGACLSLWHRPLNSLHYTAAVWWRRGTPSMTRGVRGWARPRRAPHPDILPLTGSDKRSWGAGTWAGVKRSQGRWPMRRQHYGQTANQMSGHRDSEDLGRNLITESIKNYSYLFPKHHLKLNNIAF